MAQNFEALLLAGQNDRDASHFNFSYWANVMERDDDDMVEPSVRRNEGTLTNWIHCIGTEFWSSRIPDLEDAIWRKE